MAKKTKSRLERLESKRATRSAFLYVFFSLLAIFLLLRYGITAVSYVSEIVNETLGNSSPISISGTSVPPAPPRLNSIPNFTKEEKITVRGSAVSGYDVVVYVNGDEYKVISNAQGEFSVSVPISQTEPNIIYAKTISPKGIESKDSDRFTVNFDEEPPEIEIISPGNEVFGESNRQVTIEGQTDPGSQVRINDRIIIVRSDGKFDHRVRLENGDNTFKIKAIDEAGNETEIEKLIKFIS